MFFVFPESSSIGRVDLEGKTPTNKTSGVVSCRSVKEVIDYLRSFRAVLWSEVILTVCL